MGQLTAEFEIPVDFADQFKLETLTDAYFVIEPVGNGLKPQTVTIRTQLLLTLERTTQIPLTFGESNLTSALLGDYLSKLPREKLTTPTGFASLPLRPWAKYAKTGSDSKNCFSINSASPAN